jgi:hypothetical protein
LDFSIFYINDKQNFKIMRKLIKFIIIIAILSTSCKKGFLEENPKGSMTPESFYKTGSDLELASIALYNNLNAAFNQSDGFAPLWGGDDVTVVRSGNKETWSDYDTFQPVSSNQGATYFWNSLYTTIKSCNALLANYEGATDATLEQRNQAAGQAFFIRALSYFFLTRIWGPLPLVTNTDVDFKIDLSDPELVYELIVSDLQNAEELLPNQWDGARRQNGIDIAPTPGSAKSLLASVYLTMAGWPLKQTQYYALSAAKAKEVIDNRTTWGYELTPNFADLWKESGNFNHETVFGCYYNADVPNAWGNNSGNARPQSFQAEEEGGWGDGYGEINFYNKFPSGPRKDATYQSTYYINNDPNDVVGWENTMNKHPYIQKYRFDEYYDPLTHYNANWIDGRTVYIMRYAEVLLIYAEAESMSSSPDGTAYDAINQVKLRAGVNNLTTGLSQDAFKDSVIVERGWEFAGVEPGGARWFDLIRTETVNKANSDRAPSEAELRNIPDDISHTFYWTPYPYNDQQLNPNLHH